MRDVIKHALTLYRKEKMNVFECPADQPQCFDLRQIDDDSDYDSEEEQPTTFFKPLWELPALDLT